MPEARRGCRADGSPCRGSEAVSEQADSHRRAFGPGSGTDGATRIVAQHLGAALKQPVTTDNRPGASGAIAASAVGQSAPEGYTLLIGTNSTHGANPGLIAKLPYPSQLWNVEYAAEQSGTRLVVVLGHTHCGAILGTLERLRRPAPQVHQTGAAGLPAPELGYDRDTQIRKSVRANVRREPPGPGRRILSARMRPLSGSQSERSDDGSGSLWRARIATHCRHQRFPIE